MELVYGCYNWTIVTEEEFIEILNGEDLELSFLISGEPDSRVEPSEGYFEDTDEALLWLRACYVFILNHLQEYTTERDGVIEDFDCYDGFLSRLEVLVDEYLGDIEKFELTSEGLYDGFIDDDTDSEEYD